MFEAYLREQFLDAETQAQYAHLLQMSDIKAMARLLAKPFQTIDFQPIKVIFDAVSVGAVIGVENAAREKLVLKIFPAQCQAGELQKMLEVQKILLREGFPLPSLRSDLLKLSPFLSGVLMDYVEGEEADGHQPHVRQELARHLAWFAEISNSKQLPPVKNPFQTPGDDLWPTPHKPGIDLTLRIHGSAGLTKRASRAMVIMRGSKLPKICAHVDWGVKNARFREGKLIAVFDWDSLATMAEAGMVGQAAATFCAHWEIDTKITPAPDEARQFIAEYEQYRGHIFSHAERRVMAAAADYVIAVVARMELDGSSCLAENTFYHLTRKLGQRFFLTAP
jgi:hypothetical protein